MYIHIYIYIYIYIHKHHLVVKCRLYTPNFAELNPQIFMCLAFHKLTSFVPLFSDKIHVTVLIPIN